jgi:hypothetical protein
MWGEPRLDHTLHINGGHVMVTGNLDQALRRLRLATKNRALWADAVCINQSDNKEKATQIPLMAKVYRGVSRVLAWLDGGLDEERGMQMLDRLSRRPVSKVQNPDDLAKLASQLRETSIMQFISLAWFTRMWIIQEVVMNSDVTLFCGTSEISWVRLTMALHGSRFNKVDAVHSVI